MSSRGLQASLPDMKNEENKLKTQAKWYITVDSGNKELKAKSEMQTIFWTRGKFEKNFRHLP